MEDDNARWREGLGSTSAHLGGDAKVVEGAVVALVLCKDEGHVLVPL